MYFKSLLAAAAVLPAVLAQVGEIVQITENFGPNPNGVQFWIYVPQTVRPNPPVIVNPHWCTGSAQAVFRGTGLAAAADTYGYIMIFPEAPRSSKCWDISSPETLKHDAGGDSLGIASMVRWAIPKYNANPNRVFSIGASSGGMMTNVLLGAYPELFAAGSAWAGVPFACFSDVGGTAEWSGLCSTGQVQHTGAEWKTIVEAAYPGYTGWRPKMQSIHGTLDNVVNIQNLKEQIKQWTAVLDQSPTPIQTILNTPYTNYNTYIYGDKYQAIEAVGGGHNLQNSDDTILNFFELKCTASTGCFGRPTSGVSTSSRTTTTTTRGASSTSRSTTFVSTTTTTPVVTTTRSMTRLVTSTTTTTTTAPATTTSSSGEVSPKWGQCAGINYTGPRNCVAGTTCTYLNDWYSQCL